MREAGRCTDTRRCGHKTVEIYKITVNLGKLIEQSHVKLKVLYMAHFSCSIIKLFEGYGIKF